MSDVTVNGNNENGYEIKNIAGSRNRKTDMMGSAYRLRREWSVEEERFEFSMKLRRRYSQSGAGLIDAGLMRRRLMKLLGKTIPEYDAWMIYQCMV